MKYCSRALIFLFSVIIFPIFAMGNEELKPGGNGAIYNATNQRVSLTLVGDGRTYQQVLSPGEVLMLQNHSKYTVQINNNNRLNEFPLDVVSEGFFQLDDDPWKIRWHHIAQTGNMLSIENGFPKKWVDEIVTDIKKSIADFGSIQRFRALPPDAQWNPQPFFTEIEARNRLLSDICANSIYRTLNKHFPDRFDDVNDFPFSMTEVYKDVGSDNPSLLFFAYVDSWPFRNGAAEMLDFVTQVAEKAFPNDCGQYHKLRGLSFSQLNSDVSGTLVTLSSIRKNNFGLIQLADDEPCTPGNIITPCMPVFSLGFPLDPSLFHENPDKTMLQIRNKINEVIKEEGLLIISESRRKAWRDHAFFELRTRDLPVSDKSLSLFKNFDPSVSLCWKFRISKDKWVRIESYTILHLQQKGREIKSSQNPKVNRLPPRHFGAKGKIAQDEETDDISDWLSKITNEIVIKIGKL